MIFQSAYYGDDRSGIHDASDEFLHVNNTGYYKDMSPQPVGTNRPKGLPDWQALYVLDGKMEHSFADGTSHPLVPGDFILYSPGDFQHYHCIAPLTSYVWVHFSGTATEEFIKASGLEPLKIYHSKLNTTAITFIRAMIEEIRRRKPTYQLKVVSILIDFISFLSEEAKSNTRESIKYSKLFPALEDIENTPFPFKSNEEYAAMCGIDTYYFIHLFKEVTGLSPLKYATDVAMRKAGKLIAETNMDIAEISSFLGFSDTCYFSRKFKKYHNITPSDFRNRQHDAEYAFSNIKKEL